MCRSIKVLRRPAPVATRDEISAAALQFVRKVSGFRQPSKTNQAAFDGAVVEISDSVEKLLDKIGRESKSVPRVSTRRFETLAPHYAPKQ